MKEYRALLIEYKALLTQDIPLRVRAESPLDSFMCFPALVTAFLTYDRCLLIEIGLFRQNTYLEASSPRVRADSPPDSLSYFSNRLQNCPSSWSGFQINPSVAECCRVRQFGAVLCSVMQCSEMRCSIVQCVAVCCDVMQCAVCHPLIRPTA